MARVYLETSFVSACVTERSDLGNQFRQEESLKWWQREMSKHEVVTSEEVVRELGNPGHRTRVQALAMIEPIPRLAIAPEVTRFADLLVAERVMPGPSTGDALHVACAAIHRVEFILTWNVRHLANANKVRHLAVVCARAGLASPIIVPPIQLWQEPRR